MKKYFILLFFCLFLFGCGRDYEVYSSKEKAEMYEIALSEKKEGNKEKMEYINKLYEKLEIAAKNGDRTAEIELREWHEEKVKFRPADYEELRKLGGFLKDRNW